MKPDEGSHYTRLRLTTPEAHNLEARMLQAHRLRLACIERACMRQAAAEINERLQYQG